MKTDSNTRTVTRLYTVKPGDTFANLAKSHYGHEELAGALAVMNNSRANAILQVGTRLKLPPMMSGSSPHAHHQIGDVEDLAPVEITATRIDSSLGIPTPPANLAPISEVMVTAKPWYADWKTLALLGAAGIALYLLLKDDRRKSR